MHNLARSNGSGHGQPAMLSPKAPMIDSLLAYVYAPLHPLVKKIKFTRAGPRRHNPRDILLPTGYAAEVVATGLNAPVHCCFDDQGACYVSECGHKIDAQPRILKIDVRTGMVETFFEIPPERWNKTGAVTGACWYQGYLYIANTDTISRIGPDGTVEDIVTDLPGNGDHQTNYPVVGADGKLYWGQGSATNTGIVGADNAAYEWLRDFPGFHDVPGRDVVLAGHNYAYQNVLGDLTQTIQTGAYVPFGTETYPGQVIKGNVKCTGAVLRCNLDGSGLEMVAWGLRNPYGLAFHPDGRLFATEHGIDERSRRFIVGDAEDLYEIIEGAWYGWPDFASGVRLDDPFWGEHGRGREPVLAEHPDPTPPKPFVTFADHAGPNGLDFCRDGRFGFAGDAFVALIGDVTPITARPITPRGFKVVRVDMRSQRVIDFAVNKFAGPASKLPHAGFERPAHCQFGPDGALYVVDWGEVEIAPEKGGIRMQQGTGTLWRIRRTTEQPGERPPAPIVVPLYGAQVLLGLMVAVALGIAGWLFRRRHRRR